MVIWYYKTHSFVVGIYLVGRVSLAGVVPSPITESCMTRNAQFKTFDEVNPENL